MKVTIQTNVDLCSVLCCYDLLVEYVTMRSRFFGGCLGGAILINCIAAMLFFLSTTSLIDERYMPPIVQVTLVYVSTLFAVVTVIISWPLIKTLYMLQEGFLSFLLEQQVIIRNELANEINKQVFWEETEEEDNYNNNNSNSDYSPKQFKTAADFKERKVNREKALHDFQSQLVTIDIKIAQLRDDPNNLKVLSVEATFKSLGKLLTVVAGSVMSGLFRAR